MSPKISFKLAILALTTLLTACGYNQFMTPQGLDANSITVTGQGEIKATPDRFLVRAVASREGNDINQMKQGVDREVAETLALARQLGVEDKHLQATNMSVQPQWEWQPKRKMVGYRVWRDINITTQGLETYAQLLEGMTRIGLSEVHPAGSKISNEEELRQQAMAAAVDNARARAQALATAAGRELGPVLSIQVQGSSPITPYPVMKMAASEAANDSWAAGETRLVQEVLVRFQLD